MLRFPLLLGFVFALTIVAPFASASEASSAAVARLCQHVKQRKTMFVDKSKPDIAWSDGAIFEVARTFPRELQDLMAAPTGSPDLYRVLDRFTGRKEEGWQEAKTARARSEDRVAFQSADGKVTIDVAAAYGIYLRERYPKAQVRVKDSLSPVLFVVDGAVRAVVMGLAPAATEKK